MLLDFFDRFFVPQIYTGPKILLYILYNFYDNCQAYGDTPNDFLAKIRDIQELGCVSYPMRFEVLVSKKKNHYISPFWTVEKLEAIAKARRVLGFGGAFPPYEGLVNKFKKAKDFDDAFSLYPVKNR